MRLDDSLAPLRAYDQFMLWRTEWRARPDGKPKAVKVPIHPHTRKAASVTDPANWVSAAEAEQLTEGQDAVGVAFCFTASDPFFFLDIDSATVGSNWSALATELCNALPGAAVEISQSGTGLHLIGQSQPFPHGCKNDARGLELYTEGRFVALTGTSPGGDASTPLDTAIQSIAARYLPPPTFADADWTDTPREGWTGPDTDAELLRRALQSESAASKFGDVVPFKALWEADEDALAVAFPSASGDTYGRSEADAALARHLAFWTGCNCERMAVLMRQSKLVREKWDREDYIPRTILQIVQRTDRVYDKPRPDDAAQEAAAGTSATVRHGLQYCPAENQIAHFAGYTYVRDVHRALAPDGALLKPEQFRAVMGGYIFAIDAVNGKTTTDAWKAFTESQVVDYPIAHGVGFDPLRAPDEIYEAGGIRFVNSWRPIEVDRDAGDVSPFLGLLSKLAPDEMDRAILLAYMAACVQHQGHKFQWAPLIQGVQGNGKTFLTRAVKRAIGAKYVHMPQAADIANKFNSWLWGATFIGVEDIYVPHDRADVIEALKPMITADDDGIGIQGKGEDQRTARICCNFILNSNHRDALPIARGERRFAIFFTPQQDPGDLRAWGMDGDYFPNLYDWFRGRGGAYLSEYLHTYAIPDELNPANGRRAPTTTSTRAALAAARGPIEQEIEEAIAQDRTGFRGGWIAMAAVHDLLVEQRGRVGISRAKLADLVIGVGDGYVRHPGLPSGRVHNPVMPGPSRTVLFVKKGHESLSIQTAAEIAATYSRAQEEVQGVSIGIVMG